MTQGINCPICKGTHYRLCPNLRSQAIERRAIHNMTDLERAEWERAAAFKKGDHGMQRICEAAVAKFVAFAHFAATPAQRKAGQDAD